MSQEIHIQFTRFSAIYSPLIATMAGGFLEQEGAGHIVASLAGAVGSCAFSSLDVIAQPPAGN